MHVHSCVGHTDRWTDKIKRQNKAKRVVLMEYFCFGDALSTAFQTSWFTCYSQCRKTWCLGVDLDIMSIWLSLGHFWIFEAKSITHRFLMAGDWTSALSQVTYNASMVQMLAYTFLKEEVHIKPPGWCTSQLFELLLDRLILLMWHVDIG